MTMTIKRFCNVSHGEAIKMRSILLKPLAFGFAAIVHLLHNGVAVSRHIQ